MDCKKDAKHRMWAGEKAGGAMVEWIAKKGAKHRCEKKSRVRTGGCRTIPSGCDCGYPGSLRTFYRGTPSPFSLSEQRLRAIPDMNASCPVADDPCRVVPAL
jgi:hypothetical protein